MLFLLSGADAVQGRALSGAMFLPIMIYTVVEEIVRQARKPVELMELGMLAVLESSRSAAIIARPASKQGC